MKQIDEYVNSVYAYVDGHEAEELKEEMRTHLLEAVHELKSEGKSEKEAIEIAIEHFGDGQMLRKMIIEHFRLPRIFSVNLLRTAIIFAVLSILIGCVFAFNEYKLFTQRTNIAQYTLVLLDDQGINDANKELIVEYAKEAPQIVSLDISQRDTQELALEYQNSESFKDIPFINGMSGKVYTNSNWSVDILHEHFHLAWIYAIAICLTTYWVLFTIWATINAYYYRRFNAGWVLTFALLNILGYLIYVLVGKRKVNVMEEIYQ